MIHFGKILSIFSISIVLFQLAIHVLHAEETSKTANIPDIKIHALITELNDFKTSNKTKRLSSTKRRRHCKNIIRNAQKLLESHKLAPNRFEVLFLIMNTQTSLIGLDKKESNLDALSETCKEILKAPDNYYSIRLNANFLLAELNLSRKNADSKERKKVLESMLSHYRNTPVERESLKFAATIAKRLGDNELMNRFIHQMCDDSGDNPKIIKFLRNHLSVRSLDVVFSGTFKQLNGTSITFPYDRLGYGYCVVFWSKEFPESLEKLKQLKKNQDAFPEEYDIYSLNVDELKDGGQSILKEIGLKCTILHLPGGRSSQTFQTYAVKEPTALRINHFGRSLIPSFSDEMTSLLNPSLDPFSLSKKNGGGYQTIKTGLSRYLSQIRSLLIGDFLVTENEMGPENNKEGLMIDRTILLSIQNSFIKAPFRYRLNAEDTIAMYKKIDSQCTEVMQKNTKALNLWRVRNYRIVALMGLARSTRNQEHFSKAVQDAKTNAALDLAANDRVISQYCLTKAALRKRDKKTFFILRDFIEQTRKESISPIVCSAATWVSKVIQVNLQ